MSSKFSKRPRVQPFPKVCHGTLGPGTPVTFPLPAGLAMFWRVRGPGIITFAKGSGVFQIQSGISTGWVTTDWNTSQNGWTGQFLLAGIPTRIGGQIIQRIGGLVNIIAAFAFEEYDGPLVNPIMHSDNNVISPQNNQFFVVAGTPQPVPKPI